MKRVLVVMAVVIVAAVVVAVILRRPSPIEPIVWYGPQPHPYNSAVMEGVDVSRRTGSSKVCRRRPAQAASAIPGVALAG